MIRCPECKKLVDENLKVCNACGYPFDGTEEHVDVKICVECNQPVEKSFKKCPECGYSFEAEQSNENKVTENTQNNESADDAIKEDDSVNQMSDVEENNQKKETDAPVQEAKVDNSLNSGSGKKSVNRRSLLEIAGGILLVILVISILNSNGKYDALSKKYDDMSKQLAKVEEENKTLKAQNTELTDTNTELTNANADLINKNDELTNTNTDLANKNDELENGASKQLVDIKNAYEKGEWQKVIDLTAKLHEKYNGTEEDKSAQEMANASQTKIDEANAAKAAEEAKGYETGITYDQLARTPDDYFGKKCKFSGKVLQVIEGSSDNVQIRLAVNDNYDTILFGEYPSSIVTARVLEDDHITIYGTSVGTISYESTMGGTITIPGIYINKIDQ